MPSQAACGTPAEDPAVARITLALILGVLVIPLACLVIEPSHRTARVGAGLALAALAYRLASQRSGLTPRWHSFINAAVYVTLLSAAMVCLVVYGGVGDFALLPANFALYLIVVGACSLRSNPWLPGATAGIAAAQYLVIGLYAHARALEVAPGIAEALLREFGVVRGVSNLALLVLYSMLSTTIALSGRKLQDRSLRDDLTGLLNRAIFDGVLRETHERATRERFPISIAMFDLDDFKALNDEHGHAAGDRVLEAVGDALRRFFPGEHAVARYGGEEFVAMMPNTEEAELAARLEALREEVESIELGPESKRVRVSISAGVACWPDDGYEPEEVIHAADLRLYEAKRRGRNRVVSHDG